jgi:hypothetical protein
MCAVCARAGRARRAVGDAVRVDGSERAGAA